MLNPFSHSFGLDIGDQTFKLVQVRKERKSNRYRLTSWGSVDVPEGVMSDGSITDKAKAAELIEKLLEHTRGRLRGRSVVACLPESKTFLKIIDAPEGDSQEQNRRAVLKEIEQNIPLPLDEIYFDWHLFGDQHEPTAEADASNPNQKGQALRILLGAAPKQLVDDYTETLDAAGLAPVALEVETTAISRCVIPASPKLSTEAVGILDIGATRSSLVIHDHGTIQMSISIPISGDEITRTISDALHVNMADAELLKRECGLDAGRCENKMWTILLPLIDDMTQKIRNALRFYKIGFPSGRKIEHLLVCGGGAHFREIDTVLSRKLTIRVERADTFANLTIPRNDFPYDKALGFATAIGLAIRAADETSGAQR